MKKGWTRERDAWREFLFSPLPESGQKPGGEGARRRVMEGWRKKREREREKERVRSISPRVLPRSFPALSTSIKLSWVMSGGEALEKYESSNRE